MVVVAPLLLSLILGVSSQQKPVAESSAAVRMQLQPLPDEAVRQNARLTGGLSASARNKIQGAASAVTAALRQQPSLTGAQLQEKARAAAMGAFPGKQAMDVDAIAFLVLMQSAQAAEGDLGQAMQGVKAVDNGKSALRNQVSGAASGIKSDSVGDLNGEQQMRLQMAMDQRSKFIEALSNVMKKAASTSESVVQNMK